MSECRAEEDQRRDPGSNLQASPDNHAQVSTGAQL